jgi:hypothetical protein
MGLDNDFVQAGCITRFAGVFAYCNYVNGSQRQAVWFYREWAASDNSAGYGYDTGYNYQQFIVRQ